MMREAERYAEEHRRRRDEAEVRNQAETLVYITERFLRENPGTFPADLEKEVEEAVAAVKRALDGADIDAIRTSTESLAHANQKMGAA
nr:hypothetical protein GCM10010200_000860 [Actinomadura rugatobispora]